MLGVGFLKYARVNIERAWISNDSSHNNHSFLSRSWFLTLDSSISLSVCVRTHRVCSLYADGMVFFFFFSKKARAKAKGKSIT